MQLISNTFINENISYQEIIDALNLGFQSNIKTPLRHHHQFKNNNTENTLLLMPAWEADKYLGVKIVTVAPSNPALKLHSINGTYLLLDAITGHNLALFDAKLLTNLRTAAASALASKYLSNQQSSTLLMLGTGALAPFLIEAHAHVRPIKKVLIWGRNVERAKRLSQDIDSSFEIEVVTNLESAIPQADIISCATMAHTPILQGDFLRNGQHIDLVGSYRPDMREADDSVIQIANIYVDTIEGASKESGDITIPIENGTLKASDIRGDLFDLCNERILGRKSTSEITLFKSVGHALEDLVTAQLIYEKFIEQQNQ